MTEKRTQEETKRKVGRPKNRPDEGTCAIAVTISKEQRAWLDEAVRSSVDLSMSKVVRDALDLWKKVNIDKKAAKPSVTTDDYDYSWRQHTKQIPTPRLARDVKNCVEYVASMTKIPTVNYVSY